jgi:hypothetical protein
MADDVHDTIDKTENPVPKPRGTALSTPLLGILLAIVGTALMSYGFVNGVSAALDGTDGNTTLYIVLFIVGGVFAFLAIVIGLVGLVRGGHRILSFLSLLVGLVPAVVILLIYIANLAA